MFSALAFVPLWAKYTLVPDFARFLWWLVWVRLAAVGHIFHRRAVKQGADIETQSHKNVLELAGLRLSELEHQLQVSYVCTFQATSEVLWAALCQGHMDLGPGSVRQ